MLPHFTSLSKQTRPSVMEVSPQTFGLSKPILPIDHQIARDHRIAGDHRKAGDHRIVGDHRIAGDLRVPLGH